MMPAMVAAVQRPDRRIIATQSTFRDADGNKASVQPARMTHGHLGTGVVRLAGAGANLGLAEGVETALSAMALSGVPCWATLGAHRLAGVTVPQTVREVHIFGDDDDAGRLGAEKAAERYTSAGLKVLLRWPPTGFADWNDYLRALPAEGRAA